MKKTITKALSGIAVLKAMLSCAFLVAGILCVHAQTAGERTSIKGIVFEERTKEPLTGAVVSYPSDVGSSSVLTDKDGEFDLTCRVGDVLTVTFPGYETKEITVSQLKMYSIEMGEEAEQMGEVVVTAFGTSQKKASMVGSVTQIRPSELVVPSSSLTSAFAGRLAGVIAVQRSGEPGADGANFWIRGKSTFSGSTSPLIILDGVEISSGQLNRLDPEVIDGFSILKDATATALYGTRGANGVMIVTTKTGRDLEKPVINIRIEGSMNTMNKTPQMVDGVTFMNLFNEATSRPGEVGVLYSPEHIQGTIDGLDPYRYPNVNWFDEMFKKHSFSERVNFNIRGGHKRVDYFMSVGFRNENGNMKSISKDYFSYDNNILNQNYEFVNNIGIRATNTTRISLGLNMSFIDWKGPTMSAKDVFGLTRRVNPVDFPVRFPAGTSDFDGVLWGDISTFDHGYGNPVAEYVRGYKEQISQEVTSNFRVEQDLSAVTQGLRASALLSIKKYSESTIQRSANYNKFEIDVYDTETQEYTLKRVGTENTTQLTNSNSNDGDRRLYLQFMLEYGRNFNGVHDINIMALYNQDQFNYDVVGGSEFLNTLPFRKQGFAGRVSYAFDNRYLAEVNFGYNGSENFAKGHRFGFFPSAAIGYNISEEKFWEPVKDAINILKIRGSWGLVGNDRIHDYRFLYLEEMSLNSSRSYGTNVSGNERKSGPKWTRYSNENLTWEVGEKINLGLDMKLFNSLDFTFDIFRETRRDILMSDDPANAQSTIPLVFGLEGATTYGNLGSMKNEGFEFALDYYKQISRSLFISVKGTFTYAHNTILEYNEPAFLQYPNLSRVGSSTNRTLGLVAQGLYPDMAAVNGSAKVSLGYPTVLPGDIWYVNQPDAYGNYNSTIDANDRVYMGYPTDPEIVYGFGATVKWKGWDFSFFFQGVTNTSLLMSGFHPFGTNVVRGVPQFVADNRWSESNPDINAQYPRLSVKNNSNNEYTSSFWLRDASFLKLKNAEMGFTFRNMRYYLSASNLLTFSPFKYWDPEMGGGNGLSYPTQRVINLGFQITFK